MKKIITIFLISLLILSFVTPGYCYGPVRKLGRGIWNMLTAPAEIPHRINEVTRDAGGVEGITSGLVEGCVMTLLRVCTGMVETATFLFPFPPNYEPVLKDPEFFFLKIPEEPK